MKSTESRPEEVGESGWPEERAEEGEVGVEEVEERAEEK
jgi:hypothetical protein